MLYLFLAGGSGKYNADAGGRYVSDDRGKYVHQEGPSNNFIGADGGFGGMNQGKFNCIQVIDELF